MTAAGVVLLVLGLLPKLGALVGAVPQPVLGGAGVALFGMVAASGVRTLSRVRLDERALLVVAAALGVGLLPTVSPELYAATPDWFRTVFDSGISAGALVAVLLNAVLLGGRERGSAEPGAPGPGAPGPGAPVVAVPAAEGAPAPA